MKLHLSVLSAVLALASLAHSQTPPPDGKPPRRPPSVEERLERMKTDLELTDDQVAKIKPILEDARAQVDKIKEEAAGDRDAMREKGRELMDATRAKVDEILTPEQRVKADAKRKEMMDKRKKSEDGKSE